MASKNRLQQTQQQVDDVVGIMKQNVERIVEREERLNDLDQRANYLTVSESYRRVSGVSRIYGWVSSFRFLRIKKDFVYLAFRFLMISWARVFQSV